LSLKVEVKTEEKPAINEAEAKRLIEAALYASGYPLELKTLCSITRITSKRKVQEIARSLAEEYRARRGALEIVELEDGRFALQLKPKYVPRIRRLSLKPLLTEGPLKTLSYIAYRQPVPQAKVIAVRGGQAYQHISKLLEMGLIEREKLGKTALLKTTKVFADYFSLSRDLRLMRKQLEALFAEKGWNPEEQLASQPEKKH
jgi:segregation and condensation protein B